MDAIHNWPPDGEEFPHLAAYTQPLKPAERKIVGRDQEVSQVLSGLARPELCNVLLLAPAGSGKALPDGTLVPVADPRGYAPIGDLKPGDHVFGADGKPVEVLKVFPQGKKRAYKVGFIDGRSLPCCGEHLWAVHSAGSEGNFFTLDTRALSQRADLCNLAVPWNQALERPDADLGVDFLAKGQEWASDLSTFSWREGKRLLSGSIRQRKDLLWGIAGDGRWEVSACSLAVTHRALACFLQALACSLGLSCQVAQEGKGTGCWWRVHMGSGMGDLPISYVRDLKQSVSMTCIQVASEEGLYQAGEMCVVTHNTALVQGTMLADPGRLYLEVDLAKMIADLNNPNEMAARIKSLFDETERYRKVAGKDLVLFIDEFHQVVQLSPAAVEALKPLLAASGTRGIRVVAATTFDEFQQYIQPNQPLVERLYRINVKEPDRATTVSILREMAQRYQVGHLFPDDHLFECIYDYTNQYIPANSQPRKSILVLDAMLGWHNAKGRKLDKGLLADVLYDSEGVNVAFSVDGKRIKDYLNSRVLSQQFAVDAIENRLQIAVAGMNDPSKPMSSFLFTGSTGVGKANTCLTMIPVYTEDGSVSHKLAGDIVTGDYVFNKDGKPVQVLGVFPQGKREVYRVTLSDGRTLDVSDNHLWAVFPSKRPRNKGYTIYSTQALLDRGLTTRHKDRIAPKYYIPMNGAVQWPERDYKVHPYVIGALIGNGCLSADNVLAVSSDDKFVVKKIVKLIGAERYDRVSSHNYSWVFSWKDGRAYGDGRYKRIQQSEILGDFPELFHVKSPERRIPEVYMTGSVEQRWELVHGLFDTDGSIGQRDGDRYNISYSTCLKGLAQDVRSLLFSLGVACTVSDLKRIREDGSEYVEYRVHVKSRNQDKWRFFSLPRKLEIAERSKGVNKQREKTFDYVGIRSIEKMGYKEDMVCFYIDDDDHLYQANDGVVSHNTELAKGLTEILFHDKRALHRMDCSEFSNPDSVDRFRERLCDLVWQRPYSVVLLDEIEKACGEVTRILLQVLDDARLTNRLGREVSFANCYVILTTNAGSEIYETFAKYKSDDQGSGKAMVESMRLIKDSLTATGGNKFPPELLGRIDAVVPFQPLSEATMLSIVKKKMKDMVNNMWRKHGVAVYVDDCVTEYLVKENQNTDAKAGGARAVVQRMETEVVSAVSRYVNTHPDERKLSVTIEGEPAYKNKFLRVSDAHVLVRRFEPKPMEPNVSAMMSRKNMIQQFREGRM